MRILLNPRANSCANPLKKGKKIKGLPRRTDPLKKEPACGGSLTAAYSNQIRMASIRFALPTVPVTSPSFAGSIQP